MRLVLLVAVKVSGNPLGELAVTGMMSDLPAGILALGIGSMVGLPRTAIGSAASQRSVPREHR